MTMVSDKQYLEKKKFKLWQNSYLTKDKDFSGLVLFHNLEGTFVNGWRYTDGKVSHTVTMNFEEKLTIQLKSGYYNCSTYNVYQVFQDCTYWGITGEFGLIGCSDPYQIYVGTYQQCFWVADPNSTGGGGYTPPAPPLLKPIPSFSSLASNFGIVAGMTSPQVYQKIGGNVFANFLREPNKYNNACALRLSYALNMSPGHAIPFIQDVTVSGDTNNDGVKEWYFLTVSATVEYLKSTYGNCTPTNTNAIQGKTGIIWQSDCPWLPSATGHVDVWNGSNAVGHYYTECENLNFWGN